MNEQEYQPEYWTMDKSAIYAARRAIETGIENTQELLANHLRDNGETTRSNRITAERLRGEIVGMNFALSGIKKPSGETA